MSFTGILIIVMKIAAGAATCQFIFALWNIGRLPQLGKSPRVDSQRPSDKDLEEEKKSFWCSSEQLGSMTRGQLPVVSVLIPARNESVHIEACLQGVIDSHCAGFQIEVLVLDDRSEDDTKQQVLRMAAVDERIQLLEGEELPAGWMGKSYACHQLAQEAQGEWLLFMDADVRLYPHAIATALEEANQLGRGLITGFPLQITGSWLEKLVVPMMSFIITCHLPIPLIQGTSDPRFVAAHGAFMMIHRQSYSASGGHASIRHSLIDDMELARAVKRAGHPVKLVRLIRHVQMRMYTTASEVWHGYRKNIYEGVGRNAFLLAGLMIGYAVCYVLPWMAAVWLILTGQQALLLWPLLAVLAGITVKRVSDASSGQSIWLCLLLPLSVVSLIAIASASWCSSTSGKGYTWKGRRYE